MFYIKLIIKGLPWHQEKELELLGQEMLVQQ